LKYIYSFNLGVGLGRDNKIGNTEVSVLPILLSLPRPIPKLKE
jgi:hypothetical protein